MINKKVNRQKEQESHAPLPLPAIAPKSYKQHAVFPEEKTI